MSFLAPLYLAGLAAIGLPILFHMIRRTPRGKVPFSTLMFLEASPPRVTSRSKIEHWLLLLLRAAALILLALAFSRPFMRQSEDQTVDAEAKRRAILIDVSASMRRDGLWEQATKKVDTLLKDVKPDDSIGLFVFDQELLPLLSFEEWSGLQAGHQAAVAQERLKEVTPGWMGTNLGTVLPEAVAVALDEAGEKVATRATEVVVITDLQRGSRIEGLQTFDWPESLTVDIQRVEAKTSGNASVQVVGSFDQKSGLRVRVDNVADSPHERFKVEAASDATADAESDPALMAGGVQDVHVPPEQNRVVQLKNVSNVSKPIVVSLSGDDDSFDNQAWYVRPQTSRVPVLYRGDGSSSDPNELRYYLERAFLPTPAREIDFYAESDSNLPDESWMTGLSVVTKRLDSEQIRLSSKAVENGWTLIVVGASIDECKQAFEIAGTETPDISEANVEGYAMLSDVDLEHPVFQPFNDVRLADFTKLPIWKHRNIEGGLPESAKVLASLDGRRPALVELPRGNGRVLLFTFGWHDADSQFVLWSKFVPLMNSLVDDFAGTSVEPPRAIVGDHFPIHTLAGSATGEMIVTAPSGLEHSVELSQSAFSVLTEPGIYSFAWTDRDGPRTASIAANLDSLESRTDSLGLDEIRALGVPLPDVVEARLTTDEKRQLLARELESRQRFWQWVILAGIVLLLIETWLAGHLAGGGAATDG
ncbi:MAG: BatA domain-containing protein [Planctomycetota bacterium]|nr:BatA domain-containing protein [Planctomycetota bacterium]MDA0920701.1 BatA domain-containing protein [Planctomycetota bacterium]